MKMEREDKKSKRKKGTFEIQLQDCAAISLFLDHLHAYMSELFCLIGIQKRIRMMSKGRKRGCFKEKTVSDFFSSLLVTFLTLNRQLILPKRIEKVLAV